MKVRQPGVPLCLQMFLRLASVEESSMRPVYANTLFVQKAAGKTPVVFLTIELVAIHYIKYILPLIAACYSIFFVLSR